jgi:hypothetical protein
MYCVFIVFIIYSINKSTVYLNHVIQLTAAYVKSRVIMWKEHVELNLIDMKCFQNI